MSHQEEIVEALTTFEASNFAKVYPFAFKGHFMHLLTHKEANATLNAAKECLEPAYSDLVNLYSVCHLQELLRLFEKQCSSLHPQFFERFQDHFVHLLHVQLQSLFDYVAEAAFSLGTAFTGKFTYNNLLNRCNSGGTAAAAEGELSTELFNLIRNTAWFTGINTIRNGLVHRGSSIHLRHEGEETYFFVIRGNDCYPKRTEVPPEFFHPNRDEYVNLRLYCALYTGRAQTFLNKVAQSLYAKTGVALPEAGGAGLLQLGIAETKAWLEEGLALLPTPE